MAKYQKLQWPMASPTTVHDFVSGLIEKKLLAEDAVVVVLGTAPWSCCEKLGGLLKKLDVHHQVGHPMFTGMWANGQCQEPRTLRAMERLNKGEQCAVFVYVCHTTCLTLLRLLSHFFERILPCSA
jgi:hypothetical protein